MKKIFKKTVMTFLALMVCVGFFGSQTAEVDAASYGSVKLRIKVTTRVGSACYLKLSVSQDQKSVGNAQGSVAGLCKGFDRTTTLKGNAWSSKNNCYIRVEYQPSTSLKKQVKYIKVTPSDFKNGRTKTVTVSSTGLK